MFDKFCSLLDGITVALGMKSLVFIIVLIGCILLQIFLSYRKKMFFKIILPIVFTLLGIFYSFGYNPSYKWDNWLAIDMMGMFVWFTLAIVTIIVFILCYLFRKMKSKKGANAPSC